MGGVELILILLFVSVAGLNALAHWLSVPYPILPVLGGLALGFVPGVPEVHLDPDLVLILFLPPLSTRPPSSPICAHFRDNVRRRR